MTTTTETVTVIQRIARPPEKVWAALVTPELLAKWWGAGDIRPEVGHCFTMDMPQWGQVPCEVLEVVPERRLVFTFHDWRLVWTLEPVEDGTLLRLDHEGFDMENPQHRFAHENMGRGWKSAVLPRLAALVEGGA
ncbi:SRPBCC domain-containing protein [Pseudoruegeria sp. HB172150]|uniref:SRPBCC family protein n=1 Tax=Pseudoruegeria sp. HB172150 TaxID=2721164 RepID=UPI001556E12F|nr:SRPBCC domain-containing protein [Pseudoruegeria sp. HB172150]